MSHLIKSLLGVEDDVLQPEEARAEGGFDVLGALSQNLRRGRQRPVLAREDSEGQESFRNVQTTYLGECS